MEEGRRNVGWGRRQRREMTCGRREGNPGGRGGEGEGGKERRGGGRSGEGVEEGKEKWRRVRLRGKKERDKGGKVKRLKKIIL